MRKTFGILAHVDAGKTTFSEQLLCHAGALKKPGRVDHQDTFLDSHQIERARGITVFSGLASFSYGEDRYYLLDTPGHVDFAGEMERALKVLDYAVLVISGPDGIQSHTETVWNLLRSNHVPTFLFINKMDREGVDKAVLLQKLRQTFSAGIIDMTGCGEGLTGEVLEFAAEQEETLLEAFLEERYRLEDWERETRRLIREEKLFPCLWGSALYDQGIESFLRVFSRFSLTDYEKQEKESFSARVFRIRQEEAGERLTFIKVTGGTLRVKDVVGEQKINQIRLYSGERYETAAQVSAGDLCAVTGLTEALAGDIIGEAAGREKYETVPALSAAVNYDEKIPLREILRIFKILEAEDPALSVRWEEETGQLKISLMGTVHMEIVKELVSERFGLSIGFGEPEVLYRETIRSTVMGFGHFEPLRHYAEAALRLEPGARGSGITFQSECHVDSLGINFQNLIRTHVMEKEHRGVLIGAPLTDVKITLAAGISHIKHTEGGDFREAVYRAIRQGLKKADCCLLEPFYRFHIRIPEEQTGRIMSDLSMLFCEMEAPIPDEEGRTERMTLIAGRGPVACLMNYSRELAGATKGRGTISFQHDGYDFCHNPEEIIERRGYDCDGDLNNPSSSVFCAKGTSFVVQWNEAESYMHTIKKGLV
ncbi:translation factor GTPase family protein [Anaerolentibacter hominis]|uniref:translation factor GTPase family protein n=1 Tax=Anaerolentibacter hominis TaxID=3079009 RepID=UPI0031B8212F